MAAIAAKKRKQHVGDLDLVLAGGGVKGIGHVGALEVLEEHGYDKFQRVAGTSVGAIVGSLVAAAPRPVAGSCAPASGASPIWN